MSMTYQVFTRVSAETKDALTRLSFYRRLANVEPNSMAGIMQTALEEYLELHKSEVASLPENIAEGIVFEVKE